MPVTDITIDEDNLTLTVRADFNVGLRPLWDAYLDAAMVERFWGPPSFPATFLRHDMFAGGRTLYRMDGPEGEVVHGYCEMTSVKPYERFELLDGFADASGTPNEEMPKMRVEYAFSGDEQRSNLVTTTHFATAEELAELVEMGALEGTQQAMGQIDAVLADPIPTDSISTKTLSDTMVRFRRFLPAGVDQVWRAHNNADLMKQWMLGPDGWTMPVCEVAKEPGDTLRYEWESAEDGERFGFTGELLEVHPPRRMVTTEAMIGMEDDAARQEMTLTPVDGGTLLTLVMIYPSQQVRDQALATGMADGMEDSYTRMEQVLPG